MDFDIEAIKHPAIYARVSSEEQVQGTSLDDQVDKCLKQAAVYGWIIPPERIYIDDGYSGASLERPALSRLREDVRSGKVDLVMVYKLDRLSRNIKDTVNLVLEEWSKEHRVVFRSVTEDFNTNSPLGTLIFSILASFAHFERDVIKERTSNGRKRRFSEGRRAVGKPPYGYDPGEVNGTMKVNEQEAKVVRRMFEMYLTGMGFTQIARILNDEGIRTKSGEAWSEKTVRDVIVNRVYLGEVKYSGQYGPGSHEPIVKPEVFNAAQEIRRSKSRVGGRALGSPFLLGGMIYCRNCGSMLHTQPETVSRRRHKDGSIYYTVNHAYYQCGGRVKKGNGFCRAGYIDQKWLDAVIVQRLKERFLPEIRGGRYLKELEEEANRYVQAIRTKIQAVAEEIVTKQHAVDRWISAFENGQLSPEKFGNRISELEKTIEQLSAEKEMLERHLEDAKTRKINVTWAKEVANIIERWDLMPFQYQKQIVRCLIDHVTVWKPSQGKGKHKSQPEVEIDIVWNRSQETLPIGDLPIN